MPFMKVYEGRFSEGSSGNNQCKPNKVKMIDCSLQANLGLCKLFHSSTHSFVYILALQPSLLTGLFVPPSQTLRPGDGLSSRPAPQSRVKMKTKGVLDEGGQVVDRHSGVRFTVGDGDVIQGKKSKVVVCHTSDDSGPG